MLRSASVATLMLLLVLSISIAAASDNSNDMYRFSYVQAFPSSARSMQTEWAAKRDRGELDPEADGTWKAMKLPNGTQYQCFVPSKKVLQEDRDGKNDDTKLEVGKPVPPTVERQVNLNSAGSCVTRLEGWWMYEACWDGHVRQFHQNNNKEIETEHFLGKGPKYGIKDGTKRSDLVYGHHAANGPYVSMTYYNGTICDLTKKPRQVEVRLFCGQGAEGAMGMESTEVETCKYLVWMWHPSACSNDAMRRVEGTVHNLNCYRVPEEGLDSIPAIDGLTVDAEDVVVVEKEIAVPVVEEDQSSTVVETPVPVPDEEVVISGEDNNEL